MAFQHLGCHWRFSCYSLFCLNVLARCSGRILSKLTYFATVAFLQHCVEFLAITIASRRLFYENSVAFVQERHLRLI